MTKTPAALRKNFDWSVWYQTTRTRTEALCEPLTQDDMNLQAAPFVSPPKWHLAHVTWFFETFLLMPYLSGYRPFDQTYHRIFNSYYVSAGPFHARGQRGLLSRPTLADVIAYRRRVDEAMLELLTLKGDDPLIQERIWLGMQHEEQHQELFLTDLKYSFSFNPLLPPYRPERVEASPLAKAEEMTWLPLSEDLYSLGAKREDYAYDHEKPCHRVFLGPAMVGSRLITNGEYLAFMADDGYERADLWLSDGWDWIQREKIQAPLYWLTDNKQHWEYTLDGLQALRLEAPVTHVSYFEADAFARWSQARLLREEEWEVQASDLALTGNFFESGLLHPAPGSGQFYGDTWEWTQSAYGPYPGYRPYEGPLGEYNGKFMCNQFVLRGGSCVSPREHLRATYRNFFPPDSRWQFTGIRLAKDVI